MADYPATIATFPTWVNSDDIDASNQNDPNDEITAVETGLLQGFDHNVQAPGFRFDDAASLTIASGVVTITQGYNEIDTEGAAAADDLDTITIGTMSNGVAIGEGSIIVLQSANASRVVTVKNGTGNITLLSGDFVMNSTSTRLTLMYNGSAWVEIAATRFGVVTAWTPTLTCGTSGTITVNTGSSVCKAVKNGRCVTFTAYILVTSVSSPLGRLTLKTLPFTQAAFGMPICSVYTTTTNAFTGAPIGIGNQATGIIIDRVAGNGSDPQTDFASYIKAGTEIYISGSYITAT